MHFTRVYYTTVVQFIYIRYIIDYNIIHVIIKCSYTLYSYILYYIVLYTGTILDRIDYNMETAVEHAKEGVLYRIIVYVISLMH